VPEVRAHLAAVVSELVRDYDVDGVHLDYVRYPNRHYDSTEGGFVVSGDPVYGAAIGTWSAGATRTANLGSHPVGDDVTAALNATFAQTDLTSAYFNVGLEVAAPTIVGVGTWQLGGHLTRDSGVTCVTCHAVHGAQDDSDRTIAWPAGNTADAPYANFLAIEQQPDTKSYNGSGGVPDRTVSSGYGDYNTLCEECHNAAPGPLYVGIVDHAVDPGNSGYTHPLDGIVPSALDWAGAWATATGWPQGNFTVFATGDPDGQPAICESCHVAHPAANLTGETLREDVNTGAAAYILRDDVVGLCGNCHTTAKTGHHPIGIPYDSSGVAAQLANVTGDNTDTLACVTCHTGAHNWSGPNLIALDAGWIPADNGRSVLDTQVVDAVNDSMSQTCINCHDEIDGDAATKTPGLTLIAGEPEYQAHGVATHYLGDIGVTPAALNAELSPDFTDLYTNLTTANWLGYPGASTNTAWSRWRTGTTNGVAVVCESCHELEPDKNNSTIVTTAPGGHLLLAEFKEGQNGNEADAGDSDGRDNFCEYCHNPDGTHPMTSDIVDRTGVALDIDLAKDWLQAPPANTVTWGGAGTGIMSCDSCHQVHEANTESTNMILEAISGDVGNAKTGTVADGTDTFTSWFADGNKGNAHQTFCNYCHGY